MLFMYSKSSLFIRFTMRLYDGRSKSLPECLSTKMFFSEITNSFSAIHCLSSFCFTAAHPDIGINISHKFPFPVIIKNRPVFNHDDLSFCVFLWFLFFVFCHFNRMPASPETAADGCLNVHLPDYFWHSNTLLPSVKILTQQHHSAAVCENKTFLSALMWNLKCCKRIPVNSNHNRNED